MSPLIAYPLAFTLITAAAIGCYILWPDTSTPRGSHARHSGLARHELTDPADAEDPDGTQFIAALHTETIWTATLTPATGRLEFQHAGLATLARVRDKLRELPPPPRATDTQPLPRIPGSDPVTGNWPGQPSKCTCTRMVVATIEETLACPGGWRYQPGTGWLHPHPLAWSPPRAALTAPAVTVPDLAVTR